MTFDVTNSAHLSTLKTEVNTDPTGMGYNATGATQAILDLLNDPGSNVGADTTVIDVSELTVLDIANIIDPTEYALLSAYEQEWIKMFINQDKDLSVLDFKTKFLAIFPSGTTTRADAVALLTIPISRADALFGYTKEITRSDWITARDS